MSCDVTTGKNVWKQIGDEIDSFHAGVARADAASSSVDGHAENRDGLLYKDNDYPERNYQSAHTGNTLFFLECPWPQPGCRCFCFPWIGGCVLSL